MELTKKGFVRRHEVVRDKETREVKSIKRIPGNREWDRRNTCTRSWMAGR